MAKPWPQLTAAQLERIRVYGAPSDVVTGEVVYRAGDKRYDLVVVESGRIQIVRESTRDAPEELIVEHGPGRFLGELNLLTGQSVFVTARVVESGRIHRISPDGLRRLMAEDTELSDLLLTTFLARRRLLRSSEASRSMEIIGTPVSSTSLALRTYVARLDLPHLWFDSDSPAGVALMRSAGIEASELPAVLLPDRILRRATPGVLAEDLGLTYQPQSHDQVDLAVVGGGPAGLAAAVYGASEGLRTVLLEAVGPGGQAAASSRIENYLGFPNGVSGAELTGRAAVQAIKFGGQIFSPCEVVELDTGRDQLRLALSDGTEICTRAVVIASGARYRALPLEGWEKFEGAGIYHAATALEARQCDARPVAVVGGANSAGQAALFLAAQGSRVCLVVRGDDLDAGMSSYLVERLRADDRIAVHVGAEVTGLRGGDSLDGIRVTARATGEVSDHECHGLFCFIGAEPATDWLTGVAMDQNGFIRTDVQLDEDELGETWAVLGRSPLPFETSVPGVFAAGDVRRGSMKRVAAAVGEGASAVASVHIAIGSAGVRA